MRLHHQSEAIEAALSVALYATLLSVRAAGPFELASLVTTNSSSNPHMVVALSWFGTYGKHIVAKVQQVSSSVLC